MNQNTQNGRVTIQNLNQFMLFDKIPINNKTTEYRNPTTGIWEESELSKLFFSSKNINYLQHQIVTRVNQKSNNKFNISYQDENALKLIMRNIYLSCGKNLPYDINNQVIELNVKVLNHCVPKVYSETVAYQKYLNDISTLVVPLDRPVLCTMKNKTLEPKFGF
uniref:Minor capsid protein P8 central region domain-containing protein n=1 Tax=Megaviridae environmental sample TaxID=1737588 RepID=A0A5J6VL44_9VIRU|nr:MAG: hypothetical protein [Megaviridae environmental sample]